MTSSISAGINIIFTLNREDGDTTYEERESSHVPCVSELITFDSEYSYQVVDVLWHYYGRDGTRATIHASELPWHEHYSGVQKEWDRAYT